MKKIAISYNWGPMWLAVLVKHMAADRPNMVRLIFYPFQFKVQNNFESFLQKVATDENWQSVLALRPRAIGQNIFIKKKFFIFI